MSLKEVTVMDVKKRVGIMGGTFNPIHLGHMLAGENACESFDLDEVLFMPSGKVDKKRAIIDSKIRISLLGDAIEDNPHFALSTQEVDRKGNPYSYQTVADLKKKHPLTEYFYICGADRLFHMDRWEEPEKLFAEVPILVAPRYNKHSDEELQAKIDELKEKYNADIQIIPMAKVNISGTAIREKVAQGKSLRYMVHYRVVEDIKKYKLFLPEED